MHLLNSFCKVDYGVVYCPLTKGVETRTQGHVARFRVNVQVFNRNIDLHIIL